MVPTYTEKSALITHATPLEGSNGRFPWRILQGLRNLLLCLALMMLSVVALAGEVPFDQKVFDDLRSAGKPVVLHIHSKWCITCRRQAGIATSLLTNPDFRELTLLRADYGNEKALLKSLNIPTKSVFVVFKAGDEVGRSTGDTNKDSIAALFRKAL